MQKEMSECLFGWLLMVDLGHLTLFPHIVASRPQAVIKGEKNHSVEWLVNALLSLISSSTHSKMLPLG